MIYAYTGVPGTGKSLHAANDVRFALNRKHPRPVLANFELASNAPVRHRDLFTYCSNEDMTVDYLVEYATNFWSKRKRFRENYLLLVLDEVQLWHNSRTWRDASRLEYLKFFSQHRKLGYKIIMIAQSTKMIDNQFRMEIEYEVNHRRVTSMGPIGDLIALPFGGRLFMTVEYLYQSGERVGRSLFCARRADMAMYDTRTTFPLLAGQTL